MKTKNNLFSLGEFNKRHLILFIFSPITFLIFILNNGDNDDHKNKLTETVQTFTNYLGYILIQGSIYLFFYLKRKILKKKQDNIRIDKTIDKPKILLLILMIITDLCLSVLIILLSKFKIGYTNLLFFQIVFLWIFSFIILKLKIEKHHTVTIIIMIIGIFIMTDIFLPKRFKFNNLKSYLLVLGLILFHLINSIHFIIGHYIFYELEFHYYLGLLILGVIGVLFILLISFISYLMKFQTINLFNDFDEFLKKDKNIKYLIIYIVINSVIQGVYFTFIWLVFKFFKPWYYGTTIIIDTIIFRIICIRKENQNFKLYEIFLYIILIFTTFIFNEQIICNFWGLDKNTKIGIINRANIDTVKLLNDEELSIEKDFYDD